MKNNNSTNLNTTELPVKKVSYDLNFYEALKEVLENKSWVKGDNFIDGIYLKKDANGNLVTVDASRLYIEEPTIIGGLYRQKYRVITVATMKELMK